MQAVPPPPQAFAALPSRQLPCASQHPEQVVGPHLVVPTHVPPLLVALHCCDARQATHCAPPLPHCAASVPLTHWPVDGSQQPLGQLDALHVGAGVHVCVDALHCSPNAVQSTHMYPPLPQAAAPSPGRQAPVVSQQPVGQFDGVHDLESISTSYWMSGFASSIPASSGVSSYSAGSRFVRPPHAAEDAAASSTQNKDKRVRDRPATMLMETSTENESIVSRLGDGCTNPARPPGGEPRQASAFGVA